MVDQTATARIQRLVRWLEQFKPCFGHRAQLLSLRSYVQGVFSESERKSMQAMLARITEPVAYQAFQHFITDAPWSRRVWSRCVDHYRRGGCCCSTHSFRSWQHSWGRRGSTAARWARSYCQVARRRRVDAWRLFLGATLYLPKSG